MTTDFYRCLPRHASFAAMADAGSYSPLPDDWVIGAADIVGSTDLIRQNRYKMVNMVGASVISAHMNGLPEVFPYVFGGDGAVLACGPDQAEESARILGVLRRWAQEEFGIELRVAQVPVAAIRAAGAEVAVARYQASEAVDYAMFSGGGVSWAERRMKAGDFAVPPAATGATPDLTGLSCRWSSAPAKNGVVLSVVVQKADGAEEDAFGHVAAGIVALAGQLERGGHPLPAQGPSVQWPPPGLSMEAHASRRGGSLLLRKIYLLAGSLFAWSLFRSGLRLGSFDPGHYARVLSRNADFRKFDDGLKMTLDCDRETADRLRALLERAQAEGTVRFGLFEQSRAMITCFVPSALRDDHIHLVDGESGGYTRAAEQIKSPG